MEEHSRIHSEVPDARKTHKKKRNNRHRFISIKRREHTPSQYEELAIMKNKKIERRTKNNKRDIDSYSHICGTYSVITATR